MLPISTLRAMLTGNAAIVALVGSRIFPNRIQSDETLPALTYQMISFEPDYTQDGRSSGGAGDYEVFQITCYASTMLVAESIKNAVIAWTDSLHGRAAEYHGFIVSCLPDEEPETGICKYYVDVGIRKAR